MIINGRMVFVFIKRKGGGGATPSKMNKSTFLTGAYWYHFADYSGAAGGYVMDMPSQFQSSPAKVGHLSRTIEVLNSIYRIELAAISRLRA